MIVLSNCLAEKTDEGCIKLAVSLVKRIKRQRPDTVVVTCGEAEAVGDLHFPVNRLMLGRGLVRFLLSRRESLLYIPSVARARAMAARIFCLSLFARRGMKVVLVMQYDTDALSRLLLRLSRAELITLSRESFEYYRGIVGEKASQLKAGVDCERFVPVTAEEKLRLRENYGLPADKPIVLHVGHLKGRRNLGALRAVDGRYHCVLVLSGYSPEAREEQLLHELRTQANLSIIDSYQPHIEELYQLSDVYLFPVQTRHGCIDLPLSALEAASCGIPVLCTAYGELRELVGKGGFYEIESFEPESLNALIDRAIKEKKDTRKFALEYNWTAAVEKLLPDETDRR